MSTEAQHKISNICYSHKYVTEIFIYIHQNNKNIYKNIIGEIPNHKEPTSSLMVKCSIELGIVID
jgi:hypothetical protein